jgi:restriction endonuclease
MVINIDAFRKDAEDTGEGQGSAPNVIYKQIDRMSGQRPIDFLQAARPIVVLDEPQSIDSTEKAQAAIQRLNPLCTLRYSATHREEHNLVYRLDPVRAFELKLVKQIVVTSVAADGGANAAFVRIEQVDHTKGIVAKVRIHVTGKDGPKEKLVALKSGDDLFVKSGERECKALDDRPDIHLFVKLPRWFVVETPVGPYTPDWAIVKHYDATVYMVRETKGTKDFRKRRGAENDKVRCGARHFEALGVSFDVVTSHAEL